MEDARPRILRPLAQRRESSHLTPMLATCSQARQPQDFASKGGSSETMTPSLTQQSSDESTSPLAMEPDTLVTRTRSIINLTSSTLFGIYAPSENDASIRTQPPTPSPANSASSFFRNYLEEDTRPPVIGAFDGPQRSKAEIPEYQRRSRMNKIPRALWITWRIILLFGLGIAYGTIISHLHDSQHIATVKMQGLTRSWSYLVAWGMAGVCLGLLLPIIDDWSDTIFSQKGETAGIEIRPTSVKQEDKMDLASKIESKRSSVLPSFGADWTPAIRSVGAFIGIAFAIRRLPWESTMQASLSLALVNPFLWYLIDRSRVGFILSLAVGVIGTAAVLFANPSLVPHTTPSTVSQGVLYNQSIGNLTSAEITEPARFSINSEDIGAYTWMTSVLFCSSVCFGNIGRRLVLDSRAL